MWRVFKGLRNTGTEGDGGGQFRVTGPERTWIGCGSWIGEMRDSNALLVLPINGGTLQ